MNYSIYQKNIFNEIENGKSSLVISAVAGSGKTTTLVECLNRADEGLTSVFLAFNNAIVDELRNRVQREDVNVTTMHSFCWKALMTHYGFKCELRPNKAIKYIEKVCLSKGIEKEKLNFYMYVYSTMLDLVRQNYIEDVDGIISLGDKHSFLLSEDDGKYILEILSLMNKDKRTFDFTDMIYRTIKDDVTLNKFDLVFVDESQDLSKIQQIIVSKIKTKRGRMIAVGDPNQAIYGFAGADVDSYDNLKNLFKNTKELPLSVNYRCGKRIIAEAKKINPQIEAFEDKEDGEVKTGFIANIKDGDWVLCRNVKPLVIMNLYLLANDIKSYVRGDDIGMGLISMVNKTASTTIKTMKAKLVATLMGERRKLKNLGVKNPDNTDKIDSLRNRIDVLTILSYDLIYTKDLKQRIKDIFKDSGKGVCLSTIHKSKGLENEVIHILCPELIPSKFAEQDWELKQEENLKYVAITRAKSKLVYLNDYETATREVKKLLNLDEVI
jgi:superfamily I DNA/RNA helicase